MSTSQRIYPHSPGLMVHDVASTRRIEQTAMQSLPANTLMQRAGLALARLALALAPHARNIWVVCGPGNNGGDGLEAARWLQQWGLPVRIKLLANACRLPDDAQMALQRARRAACQFSHQLPQDLDRQDLLIDALLGLGASRAPEGEMAAILQTMRQSAATLLSVDLPSGLHPDTGNWLDGKPHDPTRQNRHTLSLLTLKPGLLTAHGRDACGQVWLNELGIKSTLPPAARLNQAPLAALRAQASHKGSWGDVAVVGGESRLGQSMRGAAILAASAALHAGAGRVYLCPLGPDGAQDMILIQPELMLRVFSQLTWQKLTVVCGCGGGQSVEEILPQLLPQARLLVLDADGLNALAKRTDGDLVLRQRKQRGQATVLTPHPLEAARLLKISTAQVQADRLTAAQALAERFQSVVVLKGSGSIIATPGQTPRINLSGNARLATAGTGDVLAGLIGARLAQGLPAFEAACAAVWQHGDLADHWPSGQALTASTLANALTPATTQSA